MQLGNFDPPWVSSSKCEDSGSKEPEEAPITLVEKVLYLLIPVSGFLLLCSVLGRVKRYVWIGVLHRSVEPSEPWVEALISWEGLYSQVIVLAALFFAMTQFAPIDEEEGE